MSVRIEQINVESAGPISGLHLSLSDFNLIYGLNEQGKTFLVEFVIRCLFKNLSGWKLRDIDHRGKISVAGLAKNSLSLMPSSKLKLEDLLPDIEPGMPAQISRLLVVKGAELGFDAGQPAGISQTVLKHFLSGQGILDSVQGRLSKTIQKTGVSNGTLTGPGYGENKKRNDALANLRRCDGLFQQIDRLYSGGERQRLRISVQELEEALAEHEKAKRHHAYRIDQQAQSTQGELARLPEGELNALWSDCTRLYDDQKRISRRQEKLADLKQRSVNYEWLEEAIIHYERRGPHADARISPAFLLVAVAALFLALLVALIYPLATIIPLIAAGVFGWLYIRQYREVVQHALDVAEMDELKAEYQSRFGLPLTGLPQMKERKRSMDEAYHASKALHDEIAQEQEQLVSLQDNIAARLEQFTTSSTAPDQWEGVIRELLDRRKQLSDQLSNFQLQLASLGLDRSDYLSDSAAIAYSETSLLSLRNELQQARERLKRETDDLDNLKQLISSTTGDEITAKWADLIENLQRERQGFAAEYRSITAKILAGVLVNEQLDVIRAQEESNIREKLASPWVSRPVYNITKRYSDVAYEDGRLWLGDDYGRFALSDLSTGAREQVLLGLRLGFASHLMGKSCLFLLLDDAFQHADWQRRERLLSQMIDLAKEGWQITYFTMDDHIRDLFVTAGREHFPAQYTYHELSA